MNRIIDCELTKKKREINVQKILNELISRQFKQNLSKYEIT